MSVLFKALAKAAKTREAVAGTAAPIGQPAILSRGRGGSGKMRVFALLGALCFGAVAGTYLFFFTGDDTPSPTSRPATPRPRPVLRTPAQQQATAPESQGAAEPTQPVPTAGPVVAAVPSPEQSQSKAPAPVVQPAIAAEISNSKKPAQPIMSVEEDLPTVLARLRRQKAASGSVMVTRLSGRRDLVDDEGNSAIQVGVTPHANQAVAQTAYDDLMQGQFDEALRNYDKALAGEPHNPAFLLGKATAEQKLGLIAEARKSYSAVLAIDPANREALTNVTTLMAAQAPERALADLERLRQANPGFSPIMAAIGAQQAAAGNVPAAIDSLGRAVSLAPDNGLYRLNLAILQDRAGLTGDAAVSYRAALSLLAGSPTGLPLPTDQIRQRLAYLEGR